MDQLILHETGHFYLSTKFSILPEFIAILNKPNGQIGIVYCPQSRLLYKNEKRALFYTIAGGMIAEVHFFGAFKLNRCKDDIDQLVDIFGGFDKDEVFRMANYLDREDLTRVYKYISKSLEEDRVITGAEVVLKSGMKCSLYMKLVAIKRYVFGGGFYNKEKCAEILMKLNNQETFSAAEFRE